MPRTLPPILWFTGLSGAGKTTIAHALRALLQQRGTAALVLDGDDLRAGLCRDLGFSAADRREQMRRAAALAVLIAPQGILPIVALISPYADARAAARAAATQHGLRFLEIHIATPIDICRARDVKGLYARDRAAAYGTGIALTGTSAPYEPPLTPDLIIDASHGTPETAAERIAQLMSPDSHA